MMNTADRSLAFVDYALHRRFAFLRIEPAFETEAVQEHLLQHGVDAALLEVIVRRMTALNKEIREEKANLGHGFEVRHSCFVPQEGDEPDRQWYEDVVRTEVAPLLREYWFDRPEVANRHISALLS